MRWKLLYESLDFKLPPAGIVGVIGPNGAGKTTLFRMIMGKEDPDSGVFNIGDTVKISYVDQQHADINPDKSIWEQITDGEEEIEIFDSFDFSMLGHIHRRQFLDEAGRIWYAGSTIQQNLSLIHI